MGHDRAAGQAQRLGPRRATGKPGGEPASAGLPVQRARETAAKGGADETGTPVGGGSVA